MMPIILHRVAPPRKTVGTAVFLHGRAASEQGCLSGERLRSLAMERPVQWMALGELLDELERTRPAWGPNRTIWVAPSSRVNSLC